MAQAPVFRYEPEYNMKHFKRKAVIFNHMNFAEKSNSRRAGTNVDRDVLEETLKQLSFKVETKDDYRCAQIFEYLEECKWTFVVFFLSLFESTLVFSFLERTRSFFFCLRSSGSKRALPLPSSLQECFKAE